MLVSLAEFILFLNKDLIFCASKAMPAQPIWFSCRMPNFTVFNICKKTEHFQISYAFANRKKWLITASIRWWHWQRDVKICLQAKQASDTVSIGIVLSIVPRENQNAFLQVKQPVRRGAAAHVQLGLWQGFCSFSSAGGRSCWHCTAAEHHGRRTRGNGQAGAAEHPRQRCWGHGNEGNETVSEPVSHQHCEIACSEADHCFLAGESFG